MLTISEELRQHKLKATPARIAVLEGLRNKENAVALSSLEEMNPSIDRVTMYRTLNALNDKGLIHKIIGAQGQAFYSACAPNCNHNKVHDQHLHFTCDDCGQTECIEDVKIELPSLPKGYSLKNFNNVATGTCPNCAD